jgi:arylamine N-acetyltransferase
MNFALAVQGRSTKNVAVNKNMNIIKEFEKIRDIPYRIPLSLEEPDECCSGKADMLFKILKKSGYDVRYRICTFRWSDLDLPKEIQNISHDDESSHAYLEVNINGKWKIVDATWDKKLKGIFNINEWDGKSDTEIAVPVRECLSPEKSTKYIKHTSTPEAIAADLKVNREFYQAFNKWLNTKRSK